MRRIWLWAIGVLTVFVAAFWWLMLDARAPDAAPGEFPIDTWRRLVDQDESFRPVEVRMEVIGVDLAPRWATEAGNFGAPARMAYTAFQIVYPDKTLVVGGAVDEATLTQMAQTDEATFDHDAYDRLTAAMLEADQVWITHEHLDHVMAVARHPDPEALAPKLMVNVAQLDALPQFALGGRLPPPLAGVTPVEATEPFLVAPGVVVDPTPGHTAGSQVVFVTLESGRELLLIGDIVWTLSNLDTLKTRPRLLQFVVFDPSEQRARVLAQVRALHDLRQAEPDLAIVPSHDRDHLERLIAERRLGDGFLVQAPDGD